MQSVGLNGLSDILKNPGYVLAMLPDILVGLFTGKTKSLNMDNSFLPLASIVAGMFVKNPLLKMLLMGMGGMMYNMPIIIGKCSEISSNCEKNRQKLCII